MRTWQNKRPGSVEQRTVIGPGVPKDPVVVLPFNWNNSAKWQTLVMFAEVMDIDLKLTCKDGVVRPLVITGVEVRG